VRSRDSLDEAEKKFLTVSRSPLLEDGGIVTPVSEEGWRKTSSKETGTLPTPRMSRGTDLVTGRKGRDSR